MCNNKKLGVYISFKCSAKNHCDTVEKALRNMWWCVLMKLREYVTVVCTQDFRLSAKSPYGTAKKAKKLWRHFKRYLDKHRSFLFYTQSPRKKSRFKIWYKGFLVAKLSQCWSWRSCWFTVRWNVCKKTDQHKYE